MLRRIRGDPPWLSLALMGSSGGFGVEATSSMMLKFWDTAMAIESLESLDTDDDSRSEGSFKLASESDAGRSVLYPSSGLYSIYGFKIQDIKGRMHRFNCETHSLADLIACILQRVGDDIDKNNLPQILYEDEDHDKVVLASDSDLAAAVDHVRLIGWKGLRLHAHKDTWASAYSNVAAGAALISGLGVMAYSRRSEENAGE